MSHPGTAETARLLSMAERMVTQRLDDALRAVGADIDQWRVLSLLVDQGGAPMNVVAEHALLLAPKCSKLVDRMVAANLVLRRADELDRRRVLIFVSPRGRQAHADWDAAAAEVHERFAAAVGADAATLDEILRRLALGVRTEPAEAPPAG
ncbi:MarR family winged helix-turn-helix transcriptional regulator [Pseudonocardia parietis]|uniref:DNA-binding MarR family transcriptional regulator n=1 Tax=Pseudonocardia parietis TaxID=570936 RepID=A0ABS4VMI4_9PSEU|nr:MarR family winged helix-turn-helix transcriptional regulator [Pseudonocardia parietis]MBP2364779.1 DNA-binding MarR family transcriptional regulator [Pseudonocardia parietis]